MFLNTPIDQLPHTSAITIKKLRSLEINTFADLLWYLPTRYEDYARHLTIDELAVSSPLFGIDSPKVTIRGNVIASTNRFARRLKILTVRLADKTGETEVTWFNQPFILTVLKKGLTVQVSGNLKHDLGKIRLTPESYEVLADDQYAPIHTGRLVPIYPEKRGLSSRTLREKIFWLISQLTNDDVEGFLPELIEKNYQLMNRLTALKQIHFPDNLNLAQQARTRLAFEELFTHVLSSKLIKQTWQKEVVGKKLVVAPHRLDLIKLLNSLPFKLTRAQNRSLKEIIADLSRPAPMNRLLQGDVGSGKTVVAAFAAYLSFLNGAKTLFMAPTEILANQHLQTLDAILGNKKLSKRPKIILITASSKATKKQLDTTDIIIGTHALIANKNQFANIGLIIIDEQHKFGVAQRGELKNKGLNPHLLSMTATPIPRTVCLTLYGELDVSVIDEMPADRLKNKTMVVEVAKRVGAYAWIEKKIATEGYQVFVVCPLIDLSAVETMQNIKAANDEYEKLQKIFSKQCVGLLHGRMKPKEKEQMMNDFANRKIDILVSTPVVEVGVDIPNANIIVIEAAERFGLAQLHQLRGRVGRGGKQGYCLVFTEKNIPIIKNRLNTFARITSGFELAEYDLKHRGVGEMYGVKQHGITEFKIADLNNTILVSKAGQAADQIIDKYRINDYPALKIALDRLHVNKISRD